MITKYTKYVKNFIDDSKDKLIKIGTNFLLKEEYKIFNNEYNFMLKYINSLFNEYFINGEYTKKYYKHNLENLVDDLVFDIDIRYHKRYSDKALHNDIISITCTFNLITKKFIYDTFSYLHGATNYNSKEMVIKLLNFYKNDYNNITFIKANVERIINDNRTNIYDQILLTTELFDELTIYLLDKDINNIKHVDLDRCSNIIKNKYEYILNSKNFDLF